MTGDVNQVQSALNLTLRLFLRSPVVVFGAMIMAFTINVKAALIFVVTIPLLSVVVFCIMLLSIPLYRKVQEKLDSTDVTTLVTGSMGQQKTEVNPLFDKYNTMQRTLISQLQALGLNYNTAKGKVGGSGGDDDGDDDPVFAALKNK
jgi:ABC-type multidrug transport system fused ATPase/permease subunit